MQRVLDECRRLYNVAIEQRRTAWQQRGASPSRFDQHAELKDIRAAMPEYASIHRHILADVLDRLDRAFAAFFRRVRAGAAPGYPRYHGRGRYTSFTFKDFGNGARLYNGALVLSRPGTVRVRWSRPIEGTPRTVTIKREADGWYVTFSCIDVPARPLPPTGRDTGIDLGLESFATLADGTMIHNPRCYRTAERRIRTAQRRVSRRVKGSNRSAKAAAMLAKAHLKVRRQRADFHHKTAVALLRGHDTIYHEELRPANMVRNSRLATSIHDAGWSRFIAILSHKAACAGRGVIAVSPAYTSQVCSGCGAIVAKGLSVRWHACPACGLSLHRDHNAARNIERLGRSRQGGGALAPPMN
jgi:putative transposase